MCHAQGESGEVQLDPVGQGLQVIRLQIKVPVGRHLADQLLHVGSQGRIRVGQAVGIVGVDERRDAISVGDGDDTPGVVQVPMGQQDSHGLEVLIGQHLAHRIDGAHAGVDDQAFAVRARSEYEAVGPERARGESGDEHGWLLSGMWPPPFCPTHGPARESPYTHLQGHGG